MKMILFNRELSENEPFEKEIQVLQSELKPLKAESNTLHAKILAEKYQPFKNAMMKERGKISVKITQLENQLEQFEEKAALQKIAALVKANRHDIIVRINGIRVKIPENLEIEMRFSCGHSMELKATEIFRYQTRIATNKRLLSFWNTVINNHESHSKTYICEKCKREREAYIKKHHVIPNKRSGTARLTIEIV